MRIKFPNSDTVYAKVPTPSLFYLLLEKKPSKGKYTGICFLKKKITFVERSTLKTVDVWPEQKLENRMGILFLLF